MSSSSSSSSKLAQKAHQFQKQKAEKEADLARRMAEAFLSQRVEHGADLEEAGKALLNEPGVLKGTPAQNAEAVKLAACCWEHILEGEVQGHFFLPVGEINQRTLMTMKFGLNNLLRKGFFVRRCEVESVDGGLDVDVTLYPFLEGGR
jgi:hypothetical protein